MSARTVVLASVLLSLVCGGAAAWLVQGKLASEAPRGVDPALVERIAARLDALEARDAELRARGDEALRRLSAAEERLTRREAAGSGESPAAAGGGDEAGRNAAGAAAAKTGAGAAPLDAASAFALLSDPKLSNADRDELWKKIREAKLTEAVIAEYEKRAKANPNDPDAQAELADAYIRKTQEVGQGAEAGKWATKADKAYDAALALDPDHWDARFGKAISLSFWPPIFGKQPQAIKEFETLLASQSKRPAQPSHAQTYLMLGNLYAQSGKADKALEIWQQGLAAFPDNAALKDKIALAK
jgi:tetratricopeptide (TPR) repeat protein